MDKSNEQPDTTETGIRPLEDVELDTVAGGRRTTVKDAHDTYANTESPSTNIKR